MSNEKDVSQSLDTIERFIRIHAKEIHASDDARGSVKFHISRLERDMALLKESCYQLDDMIGTNIRPESANKRDDPLHFGDR